jgi:hypothetical protein
VLPKLPDIPRSPDPRLLWRGLHPLRLTPFCRQEFTTRTPPAWVVEAGIAKIYARNDGPNRVLPAAGFSVEDWPGPRQENHAARPTLDEKSYGPRSAEVGMENRCLNASNSLPGSGSPHFPFGVPGRARRIADSPSGVQDSYLRCSILAYYMIADTGCRRWKTIRTRRCQCHPSKRELTKSLGGLKKSSRTWRESRNTSAGSSSPLGPS